MRRPRLPEAVWCLDPRFVLAPRCRWEARVQRAVPLDWLCACLFAGIAWIGDGDRFCRHAFSPRDAASGIHHTVRGAWVVAEEVDSQAVLLLPAGLLESTDERGQFGAAAELEFLQDVADVGLDSVFTQ